MRLLKLTKKLYDSFPAFSSEFDRLTKERNRAKLALEFMSRIGPLKHSRYFFCAAWTSKTLEVKPREGKERELLRELLTRCRIVTGEKGLKAFKSFDKNTGKVTHKIPLHKIGWNVRVEDSPAACRVKRVEKRVWTPPRDGFYDTQEVFELENPEECLGKNKAS